MQGLPPLLPPPSDPNHPPWGQTKVVSIVHEDGSEVTLTLGQPPQTTIENAVVDGSVRLTSTFESQPATPVISFNPVELEEHTYPALAPSIVSAGEGQLEESSHLPSLVTSMFDAPELVSQDVHAVDQSDHVLSPTKTTYEWYKTLFAATDPDAGTTSFTRPFKKESSSPSSAQREARQTSTTESRKHKRFKALFEESDPDRMGSSIEGSGNTDETGDQAVVVRVHEGSSSQTTGHGPFGWWTGTLDNTTSTDVGQSSISTSPKSLLPEMWMEVCKYIEDPRSLLHLTMTSSALCTIAEDVLYEDVRIRSPFAFDGFCESVLDHPQRAQRIKALTLDLRTRSITKQTRRNFGRLMHALSLPGHRLAHLEILVPPGRRPLWSDRPDSVDQTDSDSAFLYGWTIVLPQTIRSLAAYSVFAETLATPLPPITSLSLHVESSIGMPPLLAVILFRNTLKRLRIERNTLLSYGDDSPANILAQLDAPLLEYFEVYDQPSCNPPSVGYRAILDESQPDVTQIKAAAPPTLRSIVWASKWQHQADYISRPGGVYYRALEKCRRNLQVMAPQAMFTVLLANGRCMRLDLSVENPHRPSSEPTSKVFSPEEATSDETLTLIATTAQVDHTAASGSTRQTRTSDSETTTPAILLDAATSHQSLPSDVGSSESDVVTRENLRHTQMEAVQHVPTDHSNLNQDTHPFSTAAAEDGLVTLFDWPDSDDIYLEAAGPDAFSNRPETTFLYPSRYTPRYKILGDMSDTGHITFSVKGSGDMDATKGHHTAVAVHEGSCPTPTSPVGETFKVLSETNPQATAAPGSPARPDSDGKRITKCLYQSSISTFSKSLPPEVWMEICKHIKRHRDLVYLARTSSTLCAIAEKVLYENARIYSAQAFDRFCKSVLDHPQRAQRIKALTLDWNQPVNTRNTRINFDSLMRALSPPGHRLAHLEIHVPPGRESHWNDKPNPVFDNIVELADPAFAFLYGYGSVLPRTVRSLTAWPAFANTLDEPLPLLTNLCLIVNLERTMRWYRPIVHFRNTLTRLRIERIELDQFFNDSPAMILAKIDVPLLEHFEVYDGPMYFPSLIVYAGCAEYDDDEVAENDDDEADENDDDEADENDDDWGNEIEYPARPLPALRSVVWASKWKYYPDDVTLPGGAYHDVVDRGRQELRDVAPQAMLTILLGSGRCLQLDLSVEKPQYVPVPNTFVDLRE
ncbi:hypothetical protein C8Q76DRAFT_802246 [Earliella scabrosa]|nr:hypothetical protein C8Q76DRAFT_802246 [Earliella scabrosa]